ncbi:MAG: hypothetical protein EXR49_04990 [Dehalococcoidia bacterium]|nr:hypothetical protein [Dehalococcoidia bacterium]
MLREGVKGNDSDVDWLASSGIPTVFVKQLHAKIFLNEHMAVIGSMNLTESSSKNSHEIAIVIAQPALYQDIRTYVVERFLPLSGLDGNQTAETSAPAQPRPRSPSKPSNHGACIRCGDPIDLNPEKPLCYDDYEKWAEYENPDYPERFCHSCGKPSEVTFARPLCDTCYAASRTGTSKGGGRCPRR